MWIGLCVEFSPRDVGFLRRRAGWEGMRRSESARFQNGRRPIPNSAEESSLFIS